MSTDFKEFGVTTSPSPPLMDQKNIETSESENSSLQSTALAKKRYYLALLARSVAISVLCRYFVFGEMAETEFQLVSDPYYRYDVFGSGFITWIDLILAMAPPTGAIRLIFAHVKEKRWTRTTLVAIIYLFINVAGRLSVAVFGLSFNIADQPEVLYPLTMSNWSPPNWIHPEIDQKIPTDKMTWRDFNVTDDTADRFWLYAEQGLLDFSQNIRVLPEPNPTFDINIMQRTHQGDTVIFSYPLRRYEGEEEVATNIIIDSSAKCKRRPVHVTGNQTSLPTIVVNATFPQLEEESLAFLQGAFKSYTDKLKHHIAGSVRPASERVLGSKCSTTYMYLEDANGFVSQWDRAGTILSCDVFLTIDTHNVQNYDQQLNPIHEYNSKLLLWLPTWGTIQQWGGKYNITVRDYYDEGRRSFCSGLGTAFGNTISPLKPEESEMYAATLLARIPVLAIARADKRDLPQKSLNGLDKKNYVKSTLEVKWARVGGITAALMLGQLIVISFVLWYCCHMKIPVDSPVPTARILKEVTSGMRMARAGGMFKYDGDSGKIVSAPAALSNENV
ncbi:hypothetical protein K440DRAFT_685595 [Wilcoxina mikolae CBS 423.85]|nr:hypothetical protein K440DRAFT_685595 [Wilcoxina mikolae CBS 423.85]